MTPLHQVGSELSGGQKSEPLGALVAGIAHDLNDLLAAILGQAEMLELEPAPTPAGAAEHVSLIKEATLRAANLSWQLMSYSRAATQPETISLSQLVQEVARFFGPTLGAETHIETSLPDSPVLIQGDRTQLDRVLLNLLVNARDAMPNGGLITVRLRVKYLPSADRSGRGYGLLDVTDTGIGLNRKPCATPAIRFLRPNRPSVEPGWDLPPAGRS
ncbi:MAG: histidine kinase dimerization/phospho-acceptor domain-containing protein [Vicinamibacterales bacterium]